MFKKTITFTGFDEKEYTQDFYFHLSNAELAVLSASADDMKSRVERIQKAKDNVAILNELRELIRMSCGVRSEDGKRFIKTPEAQSELLDSPAFDVLLFDLFVGQNATEFFTQLVPPEQAKQIEELAKKQAADPFEEPSNPIPAWKKEGRMPTTAEFRSMSKEEQIEAFAAKLAEDK
jgi:hypothetical protein